MPILSVSNNANIPINKPLHGLKQQGISVNKESRSVEKHQTSLSSRDEDEHWVNISDKRLKSSRLGSLYSGSRFKGIQKCGISKYNVSVDIQVNIIEQIVIIIIFTVVGVRMLT